MSTNYYYVIKADELIKDTIISAIDSQNYYLASRLTNDLLSENNIHIGKSSFGWKFIFDANQNKYYLPNRESIDNFLRTKGGVLKDEYGREISLDEFWKIVDSSSNGIDNKKYYNKIGKTYCYENLFKKENEFFKQYNPEYGQFHNDGLLFSVNNFE